MGLHIQHRHAQHTERQHERLHSKNQRSSLPHLPYKRGNTHADPPHKGARIVPEQTEVQKGSESISLGLGNNASQSTNQIMEDLMRSAGGPLDDSGLTQPASLYKAAQANENSADILFKGTNLGENSNSSQDIQISLDNHIFIESSPQRYSQQHSSLTDQPSENLSVPENVSGEHQQIKQLMGYESISKYVCQWCGRNFDRISNLKRHVLLHSGIKPFKCLYCNYRATQKANVVQHLASRHRDEMRALLHNNINVNDILVPSGPVKR